VEYVRKKKKILSNARSLVEFLEKKIGILLNLDKFLCFPRKED
jgi:hypothetical protein